MITRHLKVILNLLSNKARNSKKIFLFLGKSGRTELLEAEEFFEKEQKGSSSMPHKRNPVLCENLTGIARYIRSAVIPTMENIALWHERDISHSSVERIFAPDITIATDLSLIHI